MIVDRVGVEGGAKISERACDCLAGVVDIDSLDFHDSPGLSSSLGELRPTSLATVFYILLIVLNNLP